MLPAGSLSMSGLALAVADIDWYSTENLFRELDDDAVSILALKCLDYRNAWNLGMYPWSAGSRLRPWGNRSWARDMILPSGWMKSYPRLGMRPIARAIRRFWEKTGPGFRRGLVMTYPHYAYLRDMVRPEVALYYALDDYSLYWPKHADRIRQLERHLVRSSRSTVCVARSRAEELRTVVPEAAARIHHIPHGTPSTFLSPRPRPGPGPLPADLPDVPRPILGYIGSVEDRIDWPLLEQVARAFPDASLVIVGRPPSPGNAPWFEAFRHCSALPNVHLVGWRPQDSLPGYYAAFDVVLIPYRVDHRFNRACSPTKIMDAMGSTRPIVATAVPECVLYRGLFHVAQDRGDFQSSIGAILANGSDDGRSSMRLDHARHNTCGRVAARILATLES